MGIQKEGEIKMKIAIHQPRLSYYVGGGEIIPLEQAKRLAKNNEVHIITSDYEKSDVFKKFLEENRNIQIHYFKLPNFVYHKKPGQDQMRWTIESVEFCKATFEFYKNHEFDCVISHQAVDNIFIPLNQKIILHLHGFPHEYREIESIALGNCIGFTSVAKFVGENWQKIHKFNKKIYLNYNGVDEKRFSPDNTPKEFDIFYIGRLIKIKGIDYLIRAISEIKKKNNDLKVIIGGEGPEKESLIKLSKKLGLEENISFLGYIPDNKLIDYYRKSKISIFPSYAREGVLTTMLESSSCETPVITCDCCGMKEFIENGKDGILVKPLDSVDLKKAIEKLLYDEEYRIELGKNARKKILSNWNWKIRIKELEDTYKKILEN